MRSLRTLGVLLGTALAALPAAVAPPPAAAATAPRWTIRPGASVGVIAVKTPRRAVERRYGRGVARAGAIVFYPRLRLTVAYGYDRRVEWLSTTSTRYRTTRGVQVGVGVKAVRRAYPGAACNRDVCLLIPRRRSGYRVTEFWLTKGKVRSVRILAFG